MPETIHTKPLTVAQAAIELSLSKATIRSWIAQRKLGCLRLGRAVRVPADEVQRVLRAGYVPAGRPEPRG